MENQTLPVGWLFLELGKIVEYGKTSKCRLEDVESSTWVLELEDIEKESSKLLNRAHASERPFKSTKNIFKNGDVLYGKLRPYLNKLIIADTSGVCSTEIIPLNVEPYVSNSYLFYWFKSEQFLSYVKDVSYGVNMPRLGTNDGRKAPFVLAPLAEQKVIAEKLDKMLAEVEATKAQLTRTLDTLKQFRQSVLAAAVSGKLTKSWRKENSHRCEDVEHNKKLPALEDVDFYIESVPEWNWVRLGSIADLINGDRGKNYPNKSEYVGSGVPFINTGHIETNGTLSHETMNFITEEKFDSLGSGKVQPTDIVYCLRGATMGKTARVGYEKGAIASSLVIVRVHEQYDKDFLYYFLISPQAKQLIKRFDNGSAQPNLSAKSLATYPLQLPSAREQSEIVRQVEALFSEADKIEAQTQAALNRVNQMTLSILAKAFRGELTADWRTQNPDLITGDNSAEALLAKIQAERKIPKPKKRISKK